MVVNVHLLINLLKLKKIAFTMHLLKVVVITVPVSTLHEKRDLKLQTTVGYTPQQSDFPYITLTIAVMSFLSYAYQSDKTW